VTGPGRTVYFAGQLGIDKSGKMGANAREQMEIAFENVKAALASVGASFDTSSRSPTISSTSARTSPSIREVLELKTFVQILFD
jgi:enamine deaminase RidA (YjgF/YER057c/UK114 family)